MAKQTHPIKVEKPPKSWRSAKIKRRPAEWGRVTSAYTVDLDSVLSHPVLPSPQEGSHREESASSWATSSSSSPGSTSPEAPGGSFEQVYKKAQEYRELHALPRISPWYGVHANYSCISCTEKLYPVHGEEDTALLFFTKLLDHRCPKVEPSEPVRVIRFKPNDGG